MILPTKAEFSPTLVRSALKVLNYSTPLVLLTYYIVATTFALCSPQPTARKTISRVRRRWLVSLSFVTTTCYATQTLQFLSSLSLTADDSLVHAISQTLFWVSLSLIALDSTTFLPSIYIGLPTLNFFLETIICVSTLWLNSYFSFPAPHVLGGIQILTLLVLVSFATLASLFLFDTGTNKAHGETQPLLVGYSQRSICSNLCSHENAAFGGTDSDFCLLTESDDDGSSDTDDDEEHLKTIQRQRLEGDRGWLGYLMEFRIFWPYLFPTKSIKLQSYVALLLVNILIQRVLNVLHPRQLGIIIDKLTSDRQVPWKDILLYILYETLKSDSCGVGALNEMLENRLKVWSHRELSIASLDHVMGLSMKFHDQKDSGEIIKAIEQAGSLQSLLRVLILEIAPSGIDILVAMWYVTYLFDIYAALIVIAVGITFISVTYHITLVTNVARRALSRKERDQSRAIYESVGNWFTISYFNQKRYTISKLSKIADDYAQADLWSEDLYTYIFAAQDISEKIGRVAITILAAYRVVSGAAPVGNLVALESYWDTITHPLYVLGRSYRNLNAYLIDAERLLQLFHESPSVTDGLNSRPAELVQGKVAFDKVNFAYEGREPTLRAFEMHADAGQMLALVGETGSGKSTFLKLLMRFYDVTGGSITIDNHDIRDITIDSLRDIFGYVPQDSILFNTTVLENVRYGKLDATDEEVYTACKAASIHDKILSFRNGYASIVGERGVKLSGGERQRIAIARVFLKNPRIVLLDEATSAMDSQTEATIQTALKRLMQGRTTFVIAHRLSTVVEADKIMVVDRGSVVESGSHEQLLQQRGRYFNLWLKQAALATS